MKLTSSIILLILAFIIGIASFSYFKSSFIPAKELHFTFSYKTNKETQADVFLGEAKTIDPSSRQRTVLKRSSNFSNIAHIPVSPGTYQTFRIDPIQSGSLDIEISEIAFKEDRKNLIYSIPLNKIIAANEIQITQASNAVSLSIKDATDPYFVIQLDNPVEVTINSKFLPYAVPAILSISIAAFTYILSSWTISRFTQRTIVQPSRSSIRNLQKIGLIVLINYGKVP